MIVEDVDVISRRRAQNEINLSADGQSLGPSTTVNKRTPRPFMKRQRQFRIKPGVPSTYVVSIPQSRIDSGTKTAAPSVVALRRSSGTHWFPRFFLHFTTIRSDKAPVRGAPTRTTNQNDRIA